MLECVLRATSDGLPFSASLCACGRFAAIRRSELPDLTCNVNVLHSFEPANDRYDWTIGKHGLTIHFSDPQRPSRSYKATYLPSVMTKFEMVCVLVRGWGSRF